MGADLELGEVPRRVAMRRPVQVAELYLACRRPGADVGRERGLEQRVVVVPFRPRFEVDARVAAVKSDALRDRAGRPFADQGHGPVQFHSHAHRSGLHHAQRRQRRPGKRMIFIEVIDVPGLERQRTILEHLPGVARALGGEHLTAVALVAQQADAAPLVEAHQPVLVLQFPAVVADAQHAGRPALILPRVDDGPTPGRHGHAAAPRTVGQTHGIRPVP